MNRQNQSRPTPRQRNETFQFEVDFNTLQREAEQDVLKYMRHKRWIAHGHGREREGEGKSHIPEKPRSFAAGRAARASSLAGRLRPGHGPLRLHLPSHPRRPGALVSPGADPDSVVPGIM